MKPTYHHPRPLASLRLLLAAAATLLATCTADAATGKLTPAGEPIYYPAKGTVDFVAYYPHAGRITAATITAATITGMPAIAHIAQGLDKHYRLMRDVTLTNWVPLGADGDYSTPNTPFTGTFHGGGHTLTVNSIASRWNDYTGIFGEAGPCHIRQLCVAGKIGYYNADVHVFGGIVGQAADGCIIENCLVRADITASSINAMPLGGILGRGPLAGGSGAVVKNCLMLGNLNNKDYLGYVGGIVGNEQNSAIVNCVVLSREITINPGTERYTTPYRIGGGRKQQLCQQGNERRHRMARTSVGIEA